VTREDFINLIGPLAQTDMVQSKILASLTLAQACLESDFGTSEISQKSKNLFGIKGTGPTGSDTYPTTEYDDKGNTYVIQAEFRRYNTWEESISDHSGLFHRLDCYSNLIGETDFKTVCQKVHDDGYATDPNYPNSLISLIEQYELWRWDYMLSEDDANQIAYWLGVLWKENRPGTTQAEFHRLANEARKAAGLPQVSPYNN
jgi:flagellum-specific peptidoglycan hydrolase FlgJ